MTPAIVTISPQDALAEPDLASIEDSSSESSSQMKSEVTVAPAVSAQGPEEGWDELSKTAGGSISSTDDTVNDDDNASKFNYPRYLPKGRTNLPSGSGKPKPKPGSASVRVPGPVPEGGGHSTTKQ